MRNKPFIRLKTIIYRNLALVKKIIFYKKVKPDFIIVGAQKSGTTSLHYYLNQHPNLKGSKQKELHYFDNLKEKSISWYLSNFNKRRFKKELLFESTPSYFYEENIAKELIKLNNKIKIIVVLRNPIDRAYSAWNMYKNFLEIDNKFLFPNVDSDTNLYLYNSLKDKNKFLTFEEMIAFEKQIIKEKGFKEPAVLRRGLYYQQLKAYYKHIDKEQICIIQSGSLKTETLKTLNKICAFLDVEPFNKKNINIEKKHIRKYSKPMKNDTRESLQNYYKQPNEDLYQLLDVNYKWE